MYRFFTAALATALLIAAPFTASASDPVLDSENKAWSVFTLNQSGQKICYVTSSPIKKDGDYKRRGEPYLLVTYRGDNVAEISVSSGYPYKKGSKVDASVDDKHNYKLFTTDETPKIAWAVDRKTDTQIIESMISGGKFSATGHSRLGTYSKDTYSLLGFTKSYKRMKTLCQ